MTKTKSEIDAAAAEIAETEAAEAELAAKKRATEAASLDRLEAYLSGAAVKDVIDTLTSMIPTFPTDGDMSQRLAQFVQAPQALNGLIAVRRLALNPPTPAGPTPAPPPAKQEVTHESRMAVANAHRKAREDAAAAAAAK